MVSALTNPVDHSTRDRVGAALAGCAGASLLLASALAAPPWAAALSAQEAILRAKPAAVLVVSRVSAEAVVDCGHGPFSMSPPALVKVGSGWIVDGRGFVVTNAHVVLPVESVSELKRASIEEACVKPAIRSRLLVPDHDPAVEVRIRQEMAARAVVRLQTLPSAAVTVILPNGRRLPGEVKKLSPPLSLGDQGRPLPGSGRDLALLRVMGDMSLPALDLTTRESRIGDAVHALGFPDLVQNHELLEQSVSPEASVTTGAISGFRLDALGQPVIQVDAPAAHGSSGGPVIGKDGAVIGVMTFVSLSPASREVVQGFNFLVPARDVRSFLAETDVRIGVSSFNAPWAAALSAFFKADYRAAAAKLAAVDATLPDVADVRRLLAEARESANRSSAEAAPWARIVLAATFVGTGLYGGLFGRRWWRSSGRVERGRSTRVTCRVVRGGGPADAAVMSGVDRRPHATASRAVPV